jgi:hypothetical protein
MPSLSLLVVYLAVSLTIALPGVSAAHAQDAHVRGLDPFAAGALERGQRRSPRFRELVQELNLSDVIVHVVTSAGFTSGVAGTTRFVARIGGTRYLRVDLASTLTFDLQVIILAHELQHACEVARSSASSSGSVRALYQDIGKRVSGFTDVFETNNAVRTGDEVRNELRRGRGRLRTVEDRR